MSQEIDQELDLQQVVGVLWKRWWVIAMLVLTAAIAAFALSSRAPERYQATSVVRLSNPNANRLFNSPQQNVDPKRLVDTETQVLLADDMRLAVEDRLGDRRAELDAVSVTNPAGTDLVEIKVTSTSPELARDAANAYTDVYVANRRDENSTDLAQRARELRAQIDQLGQEMATLSPGDPRRTQMQASQNSFLTLANQYEAESSLLKTDAKVVDRAHLPERPVSPQPLRDMLVAAVLALVFGVGLVFLLDRLDDRISGPEDLHRLLPAVPLLGSLPIYDPERKRGRSRLPHGPRRRVPIDSPAFEAYRTVQSNVRFSSLGRSKTVLMITSSSDSEGKSTVTGNLAVSLAESGQKVIVVSADLRRPTMSELFGTDELDRGLTTILLVDSSAEDCLVPVPTGAGQLLVLPSGPLPANPAELLGSRRMGDVLRGLAGDDVDFVLLDCPPVLPVADSLAIAQLADGVIVVSVDGQTRARNLVESCQRLERVGADVVGVVLNGVSTGRGRYPHQYYSRRPSGPGEPRTIDVTSGNGSSNGNGDARGHGARRPDPAEPARQV